MAGNTVLKPELTPFHINRRELPLCGSSAKAAAAPSRMSIPWQPVAHLSLPFRQLPLGSEGEGRRDGPQISWTTSGSIGWNWGVCLLQRSSPLSLPTPQFCVELREPAGRAQQMGRVQSLSTQPLPDTRTPRQMDSNYFNIVF